MGVELRLDTIPGKGGRGDGTARNARKLWVGELGILFSYATPVAFERGTVRAKRGYISQTTSQHMSSAGVGNWPAKEHFEFERALAVSLSTELSGRSSSLFDLVSLLRAIDSVDWRRPTKLKKAIGLLAMESVRQLAVRDGLSEFDDAILGTLRELIAEETSYREQIAAKAKPTAPRRSAGGKDTKARR